MELIPGKLYRIKKEIIFFPENYLQFCQMGEPPIPEFDIEEGTILLFIKSRLDPQPSEAGEKEIVFLYKNELITPDDSEIDNNPQDYFERIL